MKPSWEAARKAARRKSLWFAYRYKMDREECVAEADLCFVRATKRPGVVVRTALRLTTTRMLDMARLQARRAGLLRRVDVDLNRCVRPTTKFKLGQFLAFLSDPAWVACAMAIMELGKGPVVRLKVKEEMLRLGWTREEVRAAFNEISENLQ